MEIICIKPSHWPYYKKQILNLENKVFSSLSLNQDEEDLASTFEDPDSIAFAFKNNKKIIAYICGGPLEDYEITEDKNNGQHNTSYIESFAVLPLYQNQGLGKLLLQKFFKESKKRKYSFVSGHFQENHPSAALMRKLGAKKLKTHPNWENSGLPFSYYQLRLPNP